jgi:hypothetical protein
MVICFLFYAAEGGKRAGGLSFFLFFLRSGRPPAVARRTLPRPATAKVSNRTTEGGQAVAGQGAGCGYKNACLPAIFLF